MSESENTPLVPESTSAAVPAAPAAGGSSVKKALSHLSETTVCLAGGVALVIAGLFFFVGGGSISSNEEFMDFYDDAVKELKEEHSARWADFNQRRSAVQSALLGVRGGDEKSALMVALLADSRPALDFLIMKRGFRVSNELLERAVLLGNVELCRYLIEEQACEPRDKFMSIACEAGHVEICRYLKEEQGMDATEPDLMRPLLRTDDEAYKMQLGMTALFTGKGADSDPKAVKRAIVRLKENHVKVAKFLVESGLNIKDDRVRGRISQCVNEELKEYLLDALD